MGDGGGQPGRQAIAAGRDGGKYQHSGQADITAAADPANVRVPPTQTNANKPYFLNPYPLNYFRFNYCLIIS
jgi:hypothetical protein